MRIGAPIAAGVTALALLATSSSALAQKPTKDPSLQTQDDDAKKKKILNKLKKRGQEAEETETKEEEKEEKKEEKKETKEEEKAEEKEQKSAEKEEKKVVKVEETKAAPADDGEELEELLEDLRKTRQKRQDKTRQRILKKWGEATVTQPSARAEFRRHARRIARLNRILEIAEEQNKTKLAKRAEALIEKEDERHEERLEQLKSPGKSDKDEGDEE